MANRPLSGQELSLESTTYTLPRPKPHHPEKLIDVRFILLNTTRWLPEGMVEPEEAPMKFRSEQPLSGSSALRVEAHVAATDRLSKLSVNVVEAGDDVPYLKSSVEGERVNDEPPPYTTTYSP